MPKPDPETNPLPRARAGELIVQEVGDETVVYDLTRDRAHCLNGTALAVWRLCDGSRTPEQMAEALTVDLNTPCDLRLVELALDQLGRAHLLESPRPKRTERMSRRDLGRDVGKVLALALPAVMTITAPTLASVASYDQAPCIFPANCVRGVTDCYKCGNGCNKFCNPTNGNCEGLSATGCNAGSALMMRRRNPALNRAFTRRR
jgi:hypothetical protein